MTQSAPYGASKPGSLPSFVEEMRRPSFYAHRPSSVELIETHISWVFLAGELVYKVKKPVVFAFLDYGTSERRRWLCHEEVRLNSRMAPSVYLGVRGLAVHRGRWTLTDSDDPRAVEHVVEMRRFDEERTLARLIDRKEATSAQVAAVGRRLAAFHCAAARLPALEGGAAAQARVCDENFESLLSFAGSVLPARELAAAQRFNSAFLLARREQLDGRAESGLVRDCHGDLRAEHILLLEEGVEVFDCVEFAPELREVDTAADLAFLVMDVEARDRPDLARDLVSAYRTAGGDTGDDALLDFFAAYRAWVRAKVTCLRYAELEDKDPRRAAAEEEARGLAAVGRRFAWRARGPTLLVVCGGTASGKTHLATGLAVVSGLAHHNSDVVRKELLGLDPTDRAPTEAYGPELNARTYAELGKRAAAALGTGGAIVDATFRHRTDRTHFEEELGQVPAAPVFVECRAPRDVLVQRAGERLHASGRISDAGPALVARQQDEFAPLDEVPAGRHLVVRTDRAVEAIVEDVEALLDARLGSDEHARADPSRAG